MAKPSDVDQTEYLFAYGRKPRGRGNWWFESLDRREVLDVVGSMLYSEAVREPPPGRWKVLT